MSITAPINLIDRSDFPASVKTSPHGFNRTIESVGIALLNWSRTRVARTVVSSDEYLRLRDVYAQQQKRENDALRITQRMGL